MELTRSLFEQHLNTRIWLCSEDGERVPLEFIQLEDFPSARTEQFSLLFRGAGSAVYPQRIYSVEHDVIGRFDLFLVPIGRDSQGTIYQAVFNRFLKVGQQA